MIEIKKKIIEGLKKSLVEAFLDVDEDVRTKFIYNSDHKVATFFGEGPICCCFFIVFQNDYHFEYAQYQISVRFFSFSVCLIFKVSEALADL